jgi:hypothetical protein
MNLRVFIAFLVLNLLGLAAEADMVIRQCSRDKVIQIYLEEKDSYPYAEYCDLIQPNTKPSFSSPDKVELDLSVLYKGSNRSRDEILADPKFKNPHYKELATLLPNYATVTSTRDKDKEDLIAEALLNVLKSRYGRFVCFNFVDMGVSFLRTFGVSPEVQEKANKLCGVRDAGAMTGFFDSTVFADDKTDRAYHERSREYIFIVSREFKEAISGWTNSFGVTYLSINPRLVTQQSFYELFIHETYMIGDAWSSIYSHSKLREVFYKTDVKDWNEAFRVIQNPYVMYGMAAYRARIFETWVLWDLGFPVQPIRTLPQSCPQDIQRIAPDIARFESSFPQPHLAPMTLKESTDYLKQHPLLCEKLYLPLIETSFLGGTSGQGPRPRVGGGWSGGGE